MKDGNIKLVDYFLRACTKTGKDFFLSLAILECGFIKSDLDAHKPFHSSPKVLMINTFEFALKKTFTFVLETFASLLFSLYSPRLDTEINHVYLSAFMLLNLSRSQSFSVCVVCAFFMANSLFILF